MREPKEWPFFKSPPLLLGAAASAAVKWFAGRWNTLKEFTSAGRVPGRLTYLGQRTNDDNDFGEFRSNNHLELGDNNSRKRLWSLVGGSGWFLAIHHLWRLGSEATQRAAVGKKTETRAGHGKNATIKNNTLHYTIEAGTGGAAAAAALQWKIPDKVAWLDVDKWKVSFNRR